MRDVFFKQMYVRTNSQLIFLQNLYFVHIVVMKISNNILIYIQTKLWHFFTLDNTSQRTSPRWHIHLYQFSDPYQALQKDYINRSTLGYIKSWLLQGPRCGCTGRTRVSVGAEGPLGGRKLGTGPGMSGLPGCHLACPAGVVDHGRR